MAAQTQQQSGRQSLDPMMDFDDQELEETLHEFLESDEEENTNIWNFSTIAGIAIFFVGMMTLLQLLGLNIGPNLPINGIKLLPLIGGILVTLVGFGYLVGDRKKEKQAKKKQRKRDDQYDFGYNPKKNTDDNLRNDLDNSKSQQRSKHKQRSTRHTKRGDKLYKSRTSKKLMGVCGGLAEYFGISSTVVRLLFVITFFAGSGTSLLLYIVLGIVLDKEPPIDHYYDF